MQVTVVSWFTNSICSTILENMAAVVFITKHGAYEQNQIFPNPSVGEPNCSQ